MRRLHSSDSVSRQRLENNNNWEILDNILRDFYFLHFAFPVSFGSTVNCEPDDGAGLLLLDVLFDCPLTVLVLLTIGRCGSDSLAGPLFWFPMLPKIKVVRK